MSRWFRHYAGLTADPKFGGVARRSKATKERVVFVWCCLLESAAETNDAGHFTIDADSIADLMGCETGEVEAVLQHLDAAGLTGGGKIARWSARQFESDTSASRTRAYRERKRHGDEAVTSQAVTVTPPETETETETETDTDTEGGSQLNLPKTEPSPRAAGKRTAPKTEPYFFEAGPIRLVEADYRKWEASFPNISLRSELAGLAGWALKQDNWFFAVPGALAKREREARLAVERIKAEALAAASAPKRAPAGYCP